MPLVVEWISPGLLGVVWPEKLTDAELEAGITHHDQLLVAWDAPYAVLHQSRGMPSLGPKQRRRTTNWTRLAANGAHRHCRGAVFVAPSPIVRGIITAVFWFEDPHYPVKTFGTREESMAWALSALESPKVAAG